MDIRQDIHGFIEKVDAFSKNRLRNKEDLSILLQISRDDGKEQVFDDLTFHAKYIYRLFGILKRTSPDAEAYPKLSAEFTDGVEKVNTLMRTLVKEAPDDIKQQFKSKYFSMTHASMENVMSISYDLSWIKNWHIDSGNDTEKKREG